MFFFFKLGDGFFIVFHTNLSIVITPDVFVSLKKLEPLSFGFFSCGAVRCLLKHRAASQMSQSNGIPSVRASTTESRSCGICLPLVVALVVVGQAFFRGEFFFFLQIFVHTRS